MTVSLQYCVQIFRKIHFTKHFAFKSYQNPTKNLVVISIAIDMEMLDNAEKMNVDSRDRRSDLCRPQVSERKPHRCELQTNPRNAIEFKTPCCDVENFMSHFADGPE